MSDDRLDGMVSRILGRPDYLASVILAYADRRVLTREQLADHLGIGHHEFNLLCLAGLPRPEQWQSDVDRLAAMVGACPRLLTTVIAVGQAHLEQAEKSAEGGKPKGGNDDDVTSR